MKRSSVGIQKEPTIMIIPMIDIVFFLLVFFMMSTLPHFILKKYKEKHLVFRRPEPQEREFVFS